VRVLVTNDDGIDSPGLLALARALLDAGHDVIVAGPATERSGSAASLGDVENDATIAVERWALADLGGMPALAVHAPPALAVRAACSGAFGAAPEAVVSGVNPGFNTGRLMLHSGTVGAAMTAASLDVCGVALSTAAHPAVGFETAGLVATWILGSLSEAGLPPLALNVNVPDVRVAQLVGVTEAVVRSDTVNDVAFARVENGLRVKRRTTAPPFDPETDAGIVAAGGVSVFNVPLPWGNSANITSTLVDLRSHLARVTAPV
jgi:5'-nucleotidase